MSEQLYDALEACLEAVDKGATLEKCLEMYPGLADELRPTLSAAYAARSLTEMGVPVEAMNRSRTRLLGKAALMRNEKQPMRAWMGLPRLAVSLMLVIVLLAVSSGSLFAASAKSLPGDKLYPVKRAVENLRVQFAPSGVQKYEAETEYQQQRIGEIKELLTTGVKHSISYEGVVEKMAEASWIVSGIEVRLTADTVIIGQISVGMLVEVEGSTELDGYVSALEIHLREYQFSGVVDSIGRSEWVISGMRLKIIPETQIGPDIGVGEAVLVLARSDNDAEWRAMAILDLGTPTETAMPTQPATNTVLPGTTDKDLGTETPEIGDDSGSGDDKSTPEPEATDDSNSGGGEETPEPEKTDEGSGPGDGESTPEPEETDDSSGSGSGESTVEPEETQEPDSTPMPSETEAQDDDSNPTAEETNMPEVTPTPGD